MIGRIKYLLFILLLCCGCGSRGQNSHHEQMRSGFDYYLLSLSWAPTFCAHEPPGRSSGECAVGRQAGFVLHGLWPEREIGPSPEFCPAGQPFPRSVIDEMRPIMPSPGLIEHEWRAHGSCSGLSTTEYFAAVKRAFENINIPEPYRAPRRGLRTDARRVEERFAQANHLPGTNSIRVSCRGDDLAEVRFCLTKDLKPRPCLAEIRDCRASTIFMRPVQ